MVLESLLRSCIFLSSSYVTTNYIREFDEISCLFYYLWMIFILVCPKVAGDEGAILVQVGDDLLVDVVDP